MQHTLTISTTGLFVCPPSTDIAPLSLDESDESSLDEEESDELSLTSSSTAKCVVPVSAISCCISKHDCLNSGRKEFSD